MTVKNQWLKKPSIQTEYIVHLYAQGLTTSQIAKEVGMLKSSVGRRLKKADVILRKSADYQGASRYWLWKGKDYIDPVTRKRNQRRHRKWSKAVRERDKNTCQDCGGRSQRLEAHHLIDLKVCINSSLEFDIDNGVTLCSKCHKKRHKSSRV